MQGHFQKVLDYEIMLRLIESEILIVQIELGLENSRAEIQKNMKLIIKNILKAEKDKCSKSFWRKHPGPLHTYGHEGPLDLHIYKIQFPLSNIKWIYICTFGQNLLRESVEKVANTFQREISFCYEVAF